MHTPVIDVDDRAVQLPIVIQPLDMTELGANRLHQLASKYFEGTRVDTLPASRG
jgi:hypothetical protein